MSVQSSIDDTTAAVVAALSRHDLSDAEKQQVSDALAQLLVKTVERTTDKHIETSASCCGPEQDLAHQIRAEMNRQKDLLVSNLKALR